jgi:hypothetical protein
VLLHSTELVLLPLKSSIYIDVLLPATPVIFVNWMVALGSDGMNLYHTSFGGDAAPEHAGGISVVAFSVVPPVKIVVQVELPDKVTSCDVK